MDPAFQLADVDAAQFALVGVVAFAASILGGLSGYGTGLVLPIFLAPIVGVAASSSVVSNRFNRAAIVKVAIDTMCENWPATTSANPGRRISSSTPQTSSANCASRLANAARSPDQFDAAFEALARERAEGVLVLVDATFWTHRARPGGPDRRR